MQPSASPSEGASSGARAPRACYRFEPRVEPLEGALARLPLHEALGRLAHRAGVVLLDSAAGEPRRFSLLAFDPLDPAALPAPRGLDGLRAFAARLVRDGGDEPPWFAGGFLGALAYDLGVAGEELALPRDPWALPPIVGGLYVDYLVRDHRERRTLLVLGIAPGDGRPPVEERRAALLADLGREPPAPPARGDARSCGARPERRTPPAEFRAGVRAVREEIARGEVYQVNLSHRCEASGVSDPLALYRELRAAHPGPYLGYLAGPGFALLSGSPELLLEVEPARDGVPARAWTAPIKGTAARADAPEADARAARTLLASAKDLAELAMIVDLERNDLGRVARPGGVHVGAFPRLESFATVHHLVADVFADLAPGRDAWDALLALFPGGSITGAPKLRSMEVLAGLEGEGRGYAYGSLVACDTRGRLVANILIRTLLWRPGSRGGEVTYRVGGGITWGSDPAAEDAESLAKGAALAAAIERAARGGAR